MDYSQLINAIEEKKCLYDKSNKNFRNINIKEAAWTEVAEITGMSKEECKRRWNLLRDKFNKEQKKQDLPSGSGAPYEDEWPYLQSMMFLKPFIQSRRTKSNNFEEDNESLNESYTEPETPSPKRRIFDPFADTCNVFKEVIEEFRNTLHTTAGQPQIIEVLNADDHFLQSVKSLLKNLPEHVKGQARIDILSYVTNLRNQHLSN